MNYFFLDFETRSKADLRKVGADNYARDPSTEVISIACSWNDEPVEHYGEGWSGDWPLWKRKCGAVFVAHNIEFERAILKYKFGLEPLAWVDTMALAAQLSLPLSLEKLAEFFGLAKDMAGHRVMKKLSRPRRPSRDNPDEFWERETKPEDFDILDDYNQNDVEVMRQVFYKMLPLTEREQKIWKLTAEMNHHGIRVDVPAVRKAKELVRSEAELLRTEFQSLVGCAPQSSVKVASWAGLPDVTATTVEAALRGELEPSVRRALELRQLLSKSSLAKLDGMLARTSPDGILRGSLVYAGAQRTGRWAGRGVQIQNFPRGLAYWSEAGVDCLVAGWRADSWLKLMPQLLRSFLTGPYVVGDFSQIEARITGWLAGEKKLVEDFRLKRDPYKRMASIIYGVPQAQVGEKQRFIGKQTVLGCGYQMGPDKFRSSLKKFHIDMEPEEAKRIIWAYRNEHPSVRKFWDHINSQALEVMHGGSNKRFSLASVRGTRFLVSTLPSGRSIFYPRPRLGTDPRFGTERIEYWGQNTYTRQWEWVGTYGGKLTENYVQATARDLLADAMLRLRERDFTIPFTAHDEVVSEDDGRVEEFTQLMKQVPPWAAGLPIDVEVFTCQRYRK